MQAGGPWLRLCGSWSEVVFTVVGASGVRRADDAFGKSEELHDPRSRHV